MKTTLDPLGSLPPRVASQLDAIGPSWGSDIAKHRDMVIAAYSPIVAQASRNGMEVSRDIAYGAHPRQVLDIFERTGQRPHCAADVVVFVHGGAFIRGAKSINGLIYDNVASWFCRQGCVAVNIEYRLADEAPYPSGAEDLALAVSWIRANIARFGGSPNRIFLMGHSAGGTHVATLLFDPVLNGHPSVNVAGAILVSARLKADNLPDNPNANGVRAYFGEDPARYEARSPASYPEGSQVPLMIVTAEFDNPYLDLYGAQFYEAVGRHRGTMPRFIQLRRHNHTSTVAHFDSGEEYLGREILAFVERVRPAPPA